MASEVNGEETRPRPTPYPEVDAALHYFHVGAQTALGPLFRGMYLTGSLALGDFDPRRSDIDFIVVTDGDVTADTRRLIARTVEGFRLSGDEDAPSRRDDPQRKPGGRSRHG